MLLQCSGTDTQNDRVVPLIVIIQISSVIMPLKNQPHCWNLCFLIKYRLKSVKYYVFMSQSEPK